MRYRPKRWATSIPATLRSGRGDVPVVVLSVSSTGLRVSGVADVPRGASVSVVTGSADLPGSVVWVRGRQAGLEFTTPQTRAALSAAGLRQD